MNALENCTVQCRDYYSPTVQSLYRHCTVLRCTALHSANTHMGLGGATHLVSCILLVCQSTVPLLVLLMSPGMAYQALQQREVQLATSTKVLRTQHTSTGTGTEHNRCM
jgi:hypothetical protein